MVKTKDKNILENILIHCNKIQAKTFNLTREEFDQNEETRDLICFYILQIGELVKHFNLEFVKQYSKVPWSDIAGMRDIVAHGYGTIDNDEVWKVAKKDNPELIEYCNQILEENN